MSERMMIESRQKYRKELGDIREDILKRTITVGDVKFSVSQIISKVVDLAASKAVDAGYSGSHTDYGAHGMICSLRAWIDGMEGRVPGEFDKVYSEILKETNADQYAEYQRLKRMFGE